MSSAVASPYFHVADLLALVSEIAPDSIVSRTFYADQSVKAIIFGFAAGQELSEHTSSRPAIMHFLQGEARITLGEDVSHAGPGTWVFMQPNLPHSIFAETPVVMMLTMLQK
ncbi:MAG TPA: cupin domain-containing protein [Anaerolineae bacterium]|nr:cupin domain-containing protein [Anaerolineae bacterium]HNU05311.1 cupin domain-containing protein [Anaerolineae bacterium]